MKLVVGFNPTPFLPWFKSYGKGELVKDFKECYEVKPAGFKPVISL